MQAVIQGYYYYRHLANLVNQILEKDLKLPYRFFQEGELELPDHIIRILAQDCEQERMDKWPVGDDPNGLTISTYVWADELIEVLLIFEENWIFGEWPADSRYSMAPKILLSDGYKLSFELEHPRLYIEFKVDKLTETTHLLVEGSSMYFYQLKNAIEAP